MQLYEYKVIFGTGEIEIVSASCENDAKILAQARQIKKGNNCEVIKIVDISKGEK